MVLLNCYLLKQSYQKNNNQLIFLIIKMYVNKIYSLLDQILFYFFFRSLLVIKLIKIYDCDCFFFFNQQYEVHLQ